MTDYETLLQVFQTMGVPCRPGTNEGDDDLPPEARASLGLGLIALWFAGDGRYLGIQHKDFPDGWQPREGGPVLERGAYLQRLAAQGHALWLEDDDNQI